MVSFDPRKLNFQTDPMMQHKIQMQCSSNPRFAEIINIDITSKMYGYINYKVQMRENINFAIKGETRCLGADTPIMTDNGLRPISEVGVGDNVLSYASSPSRRYFTFMPVTGVYKYSSRPTIQIGFKNGFQIYATPEHRFLIPTNIVNGKNIIDKGSAGFRSRCQWIAVKSLKIGDKIFMPTGYPDYGHFVNHDLSRLLGFVIGDGSLYYNVSASRHKKYLSRRTGLDKIYYWKQRVGRVQFFNIENSILDNYKKSFYGFFGKKLTQTQDKRNGLTILTSNNLDVFDVFNSMLKVTGSKKSYLIDIPDIILSASRDSKREFLRALLSTDGWISSKCCAFEYASKSEKLIKHLQLVLLEFDITSKIIMKTKGTYSWYVLTIKGRNNFEGLAAIGFISSKKQGRLDKLMKQFFKRRQPCFLAEITHISDGGLRDVYDISVMQTHSFLANGLVSHNSGKSTVAIGLCCYISSLTHVPYTVYNVCANESEYYQKVKNAKFAETYHIDEQKEAKFGSGSFREEMGIMDIQNIIAKKCVNTIFIYPSDFIARNSVYGLETYGKDLTYKLVRCIVYDLRKSVMGMMQPVGTMIVPKFQDPVYQAIPEDQWSKYRKKNRHELGRPDFDSLLEEQYEQKKDEWIEREQNRDTGYHHEERFKLGAWLRKQKQFKDAPNRKQQRIIARQIFRDLTEGEVDEIVEIARMDIGLDEIEHAREKFVKGENKRMGKERKTEEKKRPTGQPASSPEPAPAPEAPAQPQQ